MTTHKSHLFCDVCVEEGELHCSKHHDLVYYLSCCYVHCLGQLRNAIFCKRVASSAHILAWSLIACFPEFFMLAVVMSFPASSFAARCAWQQLERVEMISKRVVHAAQKVLFPCLQ